MKKFLKYLSIFALIVSCIAYLVFYGSTVYVVSTFKDDANKVNRVILDKSSITSETRVSKQTTSENINNQKGNNVKKERLSKKDMSNLTKLSSLLSQVHLADEKLSKILNEKELSSFCENVCNESVFANDYHKINDNSVVDFLTDYEQEAFDDPVYLEKVLGVKLLSKMLPSQMIELFSEVAREDQNSLIASFKVHASIFDLKSHIKKVIAKEYRAKIKVNAKIIDEFKKLHNDCRRNELSRDEALPACRKALAKINFNF